MKEVTDLLKDFDAEAQIAQLAPDAKYVLVIRSKRGLDEPARWDVARKLREVMPSGIVLFLDSDVECQLFAMDTKHELERRCDECGVVGGNGAVNIDDGNPSLGIIPCPKCG
jgi:hypothetical protein